MRTRPLICHVIFRLDYGGLENGLVNLILGLNDDEWSHVIITLNGFSDYRERLPESVCVIDVGKKVGQDWGLYFRLWKIFRDLKPAIVHTRNLATLEAQLPALLAGVAGRVHGEHGRDMHDIDNTSSKYRLLRKVFSYIVKRYTVVSKELEDYLCTAVKVGKPVDRICNGVDVNRYSPKTHDGSNSGPELPFDRENRVVFGTIGRMQTVKDQITFAEAFCELIRTHDKPKKRYALIMVGDGPLRSRVEQILRDSDVCDISWLPGARDDTPEFYRSFDIFILPSMAEGISNTILEAMASGLPIIATDVGGARELIEPNKSGILVPRCDPGALANAMFELSSKEDLRSELGRAARRSACSNFSLQRMINNYGEIYAELVAA